MLISEGKKFTEAALSAIVRGCRGTCPHRIKKKIKQLYYNTRISSFQSPQIAECATDEARLFPPLWKPDDADWQLFRRIAFNAQKNITHAGSARNLFPESGEDAHVNPWDHHVHFTESMAEMSPNQLLEAVETLPKGGGIIHLPPGRLILEKELRLPSGTRLVGTFGRTELVFKDVDYGIKIIGTTASPVTGVVLENLIIRHIGQHRFCAAVIVSHARDTSFSHVHMENPVAVGFLFSDNVARSRLSRCSVHRAGLVGFMQIRDVSASWFDSCTATQCEQSGVFLTDLKLPEGMDPLDFDAQIHYTNSVIGNFGPYAPSDPANLHTTFINCTFSGNRKMGITTDGVGYMQVINCVISDNDCEGITIDNGSWCCLIQNCQIRNNGWRGLQQGDELTIDFVDQSGLMPDGSSKAKLPGISFDNAAYCRVDHCVIHGNWGDGVKFVRAGYACTVSGNIISHNNRGENDTYHFFGVLIADAQRQHPDQSDFPSCYNKVESNTILGGHYSGVHLLPGTIGNVIQHNEIAGYGVIAIENHTDEGNTIVNND